VLKDPMKGFSQVVEPELGRQWICCARAWQIQEQHISGGQKSLSESTPGGHLLKGAAQEDHRWQRPGLPEAGLEPGLV